MRAANDAYDGAVSHLRGLIRGRLVQPLVEAPDDEAVAAIGVRAGIGGGTRSETLLAFDAEEMGRILGRLR